MTNKLSSGVMNPEIQNQIDQLFSSIFIAQGKFDRVLPANPEKRQLMTEKLKVFSQMRGRDVVYNYLSSGRGHGPFSELVDESVKYDLIGGIGINLLGHSHPIIIKAILEAATVDTLMCGNLLPYQESIELNTTILNAVKDSRLEHFWFTCSGSSANDTALKLLWQKKNPAYKIIAFDNNFAGRSVATQDITSNASYREGMPHLVDTRYAPFFDPTISAEESINKTINALEKIWMEAPGEYAALMFEPVQGEGGLVVGQKKFYISICEWAKAKGLYVWIDEVQTFGRTTELFAFQTFGLSQYVDIVSVAKSLQLAGLLYTKELNPKPGLIAGTFHGSIPSLKAGAATIKYLLQGNFYGEKGRIKYLEQQFIGRLNNLITGSCKGKIIGAGGIGTMIYFEVGDKSKDVTMKYLKALLENGVIAFSAGKDKLRVRMLLPLTLTDAHIEEIFKLIEKTAMETL